jgi:hypothetical protein
MSKKIEATIESATADVRVYLPALAKRMAWTYGPPIVAVLLINGLAAPLAMNVIPASTAYLLALVADFAVLFYGIRYLEKRYGGISHYVRWLYFSRDRRELRSLLKSGQTNTDAVLKRTEQMQQSAGEFIQAMQA